MGASIQLARRISTQVMTLHDSRVAIGMRSELVNLYPRRFHLYTNQRAELALCCLTTAIANHHPAMLLDAAQHPQHTAPPLIHPLDAHVHTQAPQAWSGCQWPG